MDHHPSWKLHRNPFWRVKHPQGSNKQQLQQQQNLGGAPHNNMTAGSPAMNPNMNNMNNNMNMNPNMNMNLNLGNSNMQIPNQFPQQNQQQQMPGNPSSSMSPPQYNNAPSFNPPELIHEGLRQAVVAYEASRDVSGVVRLRVPPGKKVEHLGIKVQFIGRIDMVSHTLQQR